VRLYILIAAVSAVGVGRDLSVYFWKAGRLQTSRIDDRFAPLVPRLPPRERLGFMTDAPGDMAGSRWFDALYALAPRVLEPGPEPRLVVADLQDPAALDSLCARWRLRVVARGGPGVALLEHE
jgi:hypothetical protein